MIESFHRCFSLIANRQIPNERFACSRSRITGIESENSRFRQRRHRKEGDKKIEEFGWKEKLPMDRFEAIEKAYRSHVYELRTKHSATLLYVDYLFIYVPIRFYSIFYRTTLHSLARYLFSYLLYFIFLSLVLVTALNESQLLPCHCLNFVSPCPFTRPSLLFNFPLASSIFIPRANQHGRGDR